MITKEEYKNFRDNNFSMLPMIRKIDAPGETPLSLFKKVEEQKNNFLFESVEGGDRWAQYSIIGLSLIHI